VIFATESGDAWMLEPEDGGALPLARAGERLPFRIVETATELGIEWTHSYHVDGEHFVVLEHQTGRVRAIFGYPLAEIAHSVALQKGHPAGIVPRPPRS
jgi:hypothetical protein